MSAKYWIKLYHEILYDRKMAVMRPELWQRTIQLFLLAGEEDDEGYLPSMDDIAWKLRLNKEQLETEMVELQLMGILSMIEARWYVSKFAERQARMDKAEYMRRKRDGNQTAQYYGEESSYQPVTNGNADKIRIDTDIDKKREEQSKAKSFAFKSKNNGNKDSSIATAEKIRADLLKHPEWYSNNDEDD